MTSPQLNDLLLEFEADLQGLARDVASGRMDAFRKDALAYLRQLRMELLRHHRRVSNKVVAADPETVRLDALLRGEHSELAERWGAVALARGARVGIDTWSPMAIVEAVDRLADEVPEFVEAPFEPESFHHPQDESAFRWLRRLGLRAQWRWARMTDGAVPVRSVAVGTLLRYHLTGTLPARLEGLAALLVDAERQLVDRTRELFDGASLAYSALAQSVQGMGDDPELRSRLSALRRHMEEELAAATKEVNQIVEDGAVRGACILGEGLKSIKQEMPRMSTLDLPTFSRRFSSVHAERTRAVRRLSEGYEQARKVVAAQYAMLALEFEMGSLEARIRDAVETFASELGRSMEGRAHLQLTRIAQALDETIPRYERLFETELAGVDLASELRNEAKPLERVVAEAARASLQLRDQLTDDQAVAPLLDSVARAARTLTDRYRIPSGRPARGEWRLPALVPVVEVPFRQVVQTHLESSVSPALLHVMREQAAAVHPLVTSLEELERRVSFNIEVAVAEIDEYQTETVPPETRAFVRDMVMGALQRSRASFADIEEKSAGWAVAARTGVHKAVLGGIEELRWQIVEGQAAELRSRLLSRATSPLRLIEDARRLPAVLRKARRDFTQAVRLAVGGDRIERARQYLGLPVLSDSAPLDPSVLAAPSGKLEHLPLVYRRLFSAQALEAGDLLVGRAPAISRARKALSGESGKRLRSVALIGADGVGKGAVANAILRGFDVQRIDTLSLTAPATVDEVEAWFAPRREGRTIALNGFYWLFAACPGGLEPLRRFVAGVVADKGRNAWMVRSDALTWAFAARLAPVLDAFAEVVELEPFDVEQLKAAVLARHGMSGYRLEFGRPEEEQGPLQRAIVSSLRNVRTHQSWFRALHRASGGLIRDALVLWMASVEAVDDSAGVVRMGKVPPPPTNALRRLPEEVLLTLWQTSRNGWTDPRVHAELFRMALSASEAHLHRMEHIGLLQSKDGRYRITVHLRGALHRVLAERGWLA